MAMTFWQELDELRARVKALEAARQDKLDRLIAQDRDDESTPFQVPPPNCSQRLQREGKPYPKSDCEACGTMSPMWRQCDVALALEAVNSKPTPNPSQIRSSLVARVADAIYRNGTGDGFREEARAAIREVAAWLEDENTDIGMGTAGNIAERLRDEADC